MCVCVCVCVTRLPVSTIIRICVCVCVTRLPISTIVRIPVMSVMNEYGALVVGEKLVPVPLCTPQLPHGLS